MFIVTKNSMRPASKLEQCFYCRQPIGAEHKSDCVLVKKTVRIRVIIEYDVFVPHSWSKEDIEFHRNESSWCASNIIDELKELESSGNCLCSHTHCECVNDKGQAVLSEG